MDAPHVKVMAFAEQRGGHRVKWLITTSYFRPDHAGIAVYATDFVDYLVEQGQSVSVVTTFPFYPAWRKRPEDSARLFSRTRESGYDLYRGYSYVPARVTTAKRILHEASSAAFGFLNFVRAGRHDVIVVFSPPLPLCVAAWAWARLTGATLSINVQDLPVDAAKSLGMMKQGLLLRALAAIEGWVYRHADSVVTISSAMLEIVQGKGVRPEALHLVPNWIDVARHENAVARGTFRTEHAIPSDAFLVSYAGNVGVKQGLDQLVELAAAFREDPRFVFVIAGEGADKERISAMVAEHALPNVRLLPFLASESYLDLLTESDLIFVAQRASAGDNFFPSKLLGIMARARPLLVAADSTSELAKEVSRSECGLVAQYGDTDALAAHVRRAAEDGSLLRSLGLRGRASAHRFDRGRVLNDWVNTLLDRILHTT